MDVIVVNLDRIAIVHMILYSRENADCQVYESHTVGQVLIV